MQKAEHTAQDLHVRDYHGASQIKHIHVILTYYNFNCDSILARPSIRQTHDNTHEHN